MTSKLISTITAIAMGLVAIAATSVWIGETTTSPGEWYEQLLVTASVGTGLTLFIGTVVLVWSHPSWWSPAAFVDVVVITAVWSVIASNDPNPIGANMWPIGAALMFLSTSIVASVVAWVTSMLRRSATEQDVRSPWEDLM